MPDPALPALLRHHAQALRAAATTVSARTAASPWHSLAAEAMRVRAQAVSDRLGGAAAAVEQTAGDLTVAHTAAIAQVESLRSQLHVAVAAVTEAATEAATDAGRGAEAAGRAGHHAVEHAVEHGVDHVVDHVVTGAGDGIRELSAALRRAEVVADGLLR